MRIVIIDDEINCRIVLRDRIAKLNSSCKIVGEASGVESGISLIEQEKPDLVFLDIQMNDGTGFDLLNKLDDKPLDWLQTDDKKLIIISGDHGAWGDELFCRSKDSVTFIANGLGNTSSDTILEVFYTPEGLIFNKVRINSE